MNGRVQNVSEDLGGSFLVTDTSPGDTVLELDSVRLFDDVGTVRVGIETIAYTSVDRFLNTIQLADSVTGTWREDSGVFPVPRRVRRYADVAGEEGSIIHALVPNVLRDKLPLGTREFGSGEWAEVGMVSGRWTILDLPGVEVSIDASSVPIRTSDQGSRVIIEEGGITTIGSDEEVTGLLSGEGIDQGFGSLYVGSFESPSVPNRITQDITYYVDPDIGSDDNDGLTSGTAFQTLQHALDVIPNIFEDANVTVLVTPGTDINEIIRLSAFLGSGSLIIDGQDQDNTIINGALSIEGCSLFIRVKNLTVFDDGSSTDGSTVFVKTSRYIELTDLNVDVNDEQGYGVRAREGSTIKCVRVDVSDAVSEAFSVIEQSIGFFSDCTGSGNGASIQCNASIVFLDGTRPTGSVNTGTAGQVFGSATGTGGGGGSGSTKKTKYWESIRSASWRDSGYGWRTDNDYVYQGGVTYGTNRGLWFYDYSDIASTLAGKTIDSIYIFITRRSEGGTSAAQTVRACRHNHGTGIIGGAAPTLSGGTDVGSLKWGQGSWLKLPNSFATALRDGTAKGIGMYFAEPSSLYDRYILAQGTDERTDSGKLKITYH